MQIAIIILATALSRLVGVKSHRPKNSTQLLLSDPSIEGQPGPLRATVGGANFKPIDGVDLPQRNALRIMADRRTIIARLVARIEKELSGLLARVLPRLRLFEHWQAVQESGRWCGLISATIPVHSLPS